MSALQGIAIDDLCSTMAGICLQGQSMDTGRVLVNNLRHLEALHRCCRFVEQARDSWQRELSLEFISDDIKRSVGELDRITGRQADQDLLERIFAAFCVGK